MLPLIRKDTRSVPESLGGFRLGMTSTELLRAKGPPIRRTDSEWDYHSIDPKHDGVLSVEFGRQGQIYAGQVFAIEFLGNRESSPSATGQRFCFSATVCLSGFAMTRCTGTVSSIPVSFVDGETLIFDPPPIDIDCCA